MKKQGLILSFLVVLSCFIFLSGCKGGKSLDLSVDMEVDKGSYAEVYINGEASAPYRLSLEPGTRGVYRFRDMPAVINRIRIDPTDEPQANIKIYGLVFCRGKEILSQLTVADLEGWKLLNARLVETNENCLHLESETDDPIIAQDVEYSFKEGS